MSSIRRVLTALAVASSCAAVGLAQSSATKIEGRGDQTTDLITLQSGLLMVGAAHKGQRNFAVQLMSTDGGTSDLLVNTIGDYQGVRLVPVSSGRYRFQVRADQDWVLMHEQPSPSSPSTTLPVNHQHTGDAPLGPLALRRGLLRASFTHNGDRNFAVQLYRSTGEIATLLVNTIGSYKGSVSELIREPGSFWLAVRASGAWSVSLQMDE